MKKISFIVIGKNEGWRLEKCFLAINKFAKEEGSDSYEIVYVDSNSTDESIQIAKKNNVNKILKITGDCNAAIGRNIGAKEASGELLFFLDGDMELIPGLLRDIIAEDGKLIYPFVSGIEIDVLHDNEWNFIEKKIRRQYKDGHDTYSVTTGGLFVIDHDLWLKVGGMDSCQRANEDLDLGVRISKQGYKLCRKGRIWVNHYTRYYGIRSDLIDTQKYKARLLRKHFFNTSLQKELVLSNYTQYFLMLSILVGIITLTLYSFIPYFIAIGYRTIRLKRKTGVKLNLFSLATKRFVVDLAFIWHFFTFFPRNMVLKYETIR